MTSSVAVPKLYIWPTRSLYLGTRYVPLRKYTVAADQLVVCLEGEIVFKLGNKRQGSCRSMLLRAGTTVQMDDIDTTNAIIAICYLNPIGQDYPALQSMMRDEFDGTDIDHAEEAALIRTLATIRDSRVASKEAFSLLESAIFSGQLAGQQFREYDPRIIKVIHRIKQTVRDNLSVGELATEVHLSESRLGKLFRDQIGIPITRYRLRYRIFIGVIHLALGYSVTDAALAAGFASTAHFSKCFSATMGTQPAATFFKPPFLQIILAEECMQAAEESVYPPAATSSGTKLD